MGCINRAKELMCKARKYTPGALAFAVCCLPSLGFGPHSTLIFFHLIQIGSFQIDASVVG